jgi:hypothetical protein
VQVAGGGDDGGVAEWGPVHAVGAPGDAVAGDGVTERTTVGMPRSESRSLTRSSVSSPQRSPDSTAVRISRRAIGSGIREATRSNSARVRICRGFFGFGAVSHRGRGAGAPGHRGRRRCRSRRARSAPLRGCRPRRRCARGRPGLCGPLRGSACPSHDRLPRRLSGRPESAFTRSDSSDISQGQGGAPDRTAWR